MRQVSNEDYKRIVNALALLSYRPDMDLKQQNAVRLGRLTYKKLVKRDK